jgi:prophage DNA circulation protein
MKTNTIKTAIVLLIVLIVAGILNAQKPKVKVLDDMDLIIEKSNQTMQKAASVSQKADQMVVAEVKEMKQTIEVLEEEKVALVEQVKTMQDEIVAIKSEPTALPFDVLAIGVPDTTSRK